MVPRSLVVAVIFGVITAVAWLGVVWRWERGIPPSPARRVAAPTPPGQTVEKFCSTCHRLPPANVEPRHLWPQKIKEMYGYAEAGGPWPKTEIPPIEQPIAYFRARAPEHLELPPDASGSPPSSFPFEKHLIALEAIPDPPAVSCVKFVRLAAGGPVQLLISDMRHGVVALWTPSRPAEPARVIGRVPHACRTTVVDLDGDGILDVVVAGLGDFWPVDTIKGTVVWLRGRGDGRYEPYTLLDGVGRVCEVQAADFDGDGDLDLIVAMFGNFHGGSILYLENCTEDWSRPDFEPSVIDTHTGASDVPIVDLNQDGRPDFVALQAQQHERIVAFLNVGRGRFESHLIYAAPHPRWGSTGIKLVDLDGDGDIDVLYNHGDSVQIPPVPRPYHGVSWLENEGRFPFTYHRIAHMPGAHTCQPADLDGDGKLAILSSAFIPAFNLRWPNANWLESLVWFHQTAPGQFQRYVIENGFPFHPCADACDYDEDGDVDVVFGNFMMFPDKALDPMPCITLLESHRVDRK
jgi:hypothetical protein